MDVRIQIKRKNFKKHTVMFHFDNRRGIDNDSRCDYIDSKCNGKNEVD